MGKSPGSKAVALSISLAAVALILCVAGVAAISAPKFMRFQDRSWQSECKANLRSIVTAERSYFAEYDRYSTKLADVGFSPEKGNRYQYRLGPGALGEEGVGVDVVKHAGAPPPAVLDAALPPELKAKLGVTGTCPDCEVTATCVGNVDSDEALDVWSVTVRPKGVSGELVNHVDDTQQ